MLGVASIAACRVKQQICVTDLRIKARVDEKFTWARVSRNAAVIVPTKRHRKRLLIEAWRKMFILRGRTTAQKGLGPYLNSGIRPPLPSRIIRLNSFHPARMSRICIIAVIIRLLSHYVLNGQVRDWAGDCAKIEEQLEVFHADGFMPNSRYPYQFAISRKRI